LKLFVSLLIRLILESTFTPSEEYGRDLEHVNLLIQSFSDFLHNLANSEGKVNVVTAKGHEICNRGHPRSSEISARCWELSQQWAELRDTANERAQALESARQVS
jgi:spectrin beta